MYKRLGVTMTAIAAIAAFTTSLSSSAQSDAGLGGDCSVISSITSNAFGTLTPLQTLPADQAQNALNAYVAQVQAQQGTLTTDQGRTDLQAYIDALQSASQTNPQPILSALSQLQADCS